MPRPPPMPIGGLGASPLGASPSAEFTLWQLLIVLCFTHTRPQVPQWSNCIPE
jgi:hypothetical protein